MAQKPIIAVFDFDETLIVKDTLFDFLLHSFSKLVFIVNCIRIIPTIVAFKLGKITNNEAKPRLLKLFLKNMPEATFQQLCQKYAARLASIENAEALERVKWHEARGDKTIIISASIEDWIKPWATANGFTEVLATQLERVDGKLTGNLCGANCHGPEKTKRLLAAYPDREAYELYAYGDGKSDREIFQAADMIFEKRFS